MDPIIGTLFKEYREKIDEVFRRLYGERMCEQKSCQGVECPRDSSEEYVCPDLYHQRGIHRKMGKGML
jgi:hypothetical protein